MKDLKPCPICGRGNLRHYELAAEVECNDCSEVRSEEDWQADTARERILRAGLTRKDELIAAQKNMIAVYACVVAEYVEMNITLVGSTELAGLEVDGLEDCLNELDVLADALIEARARLAEVEKGKDHG